MATEHRPLPALGRRQHVDSRAWAGIAPDDRVRERLLEGQHRRLHGRTRSGGGPPDRVDLAGGSRFHGQHVDGVRHDSATHPGHQGDAESRPDHSDLAGVFRDSVPEQPGPREGLNEQVVGY